MQVAPYTLTSQFTPKTLSQPTFYQSLGGFLPPHLQSHPYLRTAIPLSISDIVGQVPRSLPICSSVLKSPHDHKRSPRPWNLPASRNGCWASESQLINEDLSMHQRTQFSSCRSRLCFVSALPHPWSPNSDWHSLFFPRSLRGKKQQSAGPLQG